MTVDAPELPASPVEVQRHGWRAVLPRVREQIKHDAVTDRAAALTYFGVLAIFPGLLVVVSVLGLLGKSTTDKALDNLSQITPGGVDSFLRSVIEQVQGRAGAASAAAVIGILVALYSASGYVAGFMRASNAIYNVDEGRPAWRVLPVRIGVTLAVVVMLVIAAVIVVVTGSVATTVGHAIGAGDSLVLAWDIAKWPVLLILVSLMFSLLYWACPNVKQPGFRWVTPGGVIAVLVWLIASGLFALYVSFSGSYNKTYGSLATVIIFLVWLWISNIAILIGVEINAETQRERLVQAGLPDDVEPFVELRDTRKLDDSERERVAAAAGQRNAVISRTTTETTETTETTSNPDNSTDEEHTTVTTDPAEPGPAVAADIDDASLGDLVSRITGDLGQLVRDEMRLAQAEMTQKAKRAGLGAGLFGGAGLIVAYAIGAFVAAAILALAGPMPGWAAALIIGGALLLVAAVAALIGKREVGQAVPPVPTQAVAGVKEDLHALKPQGH